MTTEREQQLLDRCLRLEAQIALLCGVPVAPLPPIVLLPPIGRRRGQRVTADEIAQMQALTARGVSARRAAFALHVNEDTIRRHTKGAP